ncbi:MAG: 5'/3'-nucleotidase SurE [Lachnospiraceae bacterium]|nr:5'/3'-nucleotidase SurE [Lachnospiraceae bacterium]
MNILIVNDDGIRAEGIWQLARLAKKLGTVTIVSPLHQCSGMSHSISFEQELFVRKVVSPIEDITAYSVSGRPADCVRVGIEHLTLEKPDIVFSGINLGYNIGYEILYSGTVGAAMEALTYGVPAIAFSQDNYDDFSAIETYFDEITDHLLHSDIAPNQIWNVNFPNATANEIKGIDYDCIPAKALFHHDHFEMEQLGSQMYQIHTFYEKKKSAEAGTDMDSLLHNRIAVGRLTSIV